ncbi:MAG: acyl-CoA dehydrogenase family protein, partial [Candidatus Rokubacteria bacterium]|nr:acyl-CoA dehydrogenase family protein [Candidatus Rokubacteria bacterium]
MDFSFTDEQELFRKTVRQFSEREVRPQYADRERPDYDLPAFLQRMAEL